MTRRAQMFRASCVAVLASLSLPLAALAVGSGPAPAPAVRPSAEGAYNDGLKHKAGKRFGDAAAEFRRAVNLRENFPEAWNELGFALRQTGDYGGAIAAYDRALALRPAFPEALEYLGEAYVKLGRLDDAASVLKRLRALDATRAGELEAVMRAGK